MKSFPPEELPIISARKVALRIGQENLFCDQKFKIENFFPKLLEIWAEDPSSSTLLSQISFGQDLEPIMPFATFLYPLGACSSVVESLSRSYEVSVSVSMVFESLCKVYADLYEMKIRIWCLISIAECVPKGKDYGRNRTVGKMEFCQVNNLKCNDSHLTV